MHIIPYILKSTLQGDQEIFTVWSILQRSNEMNKNDNISYLICYIIPNIKYQIQWNVNIVKLLLPTKPFIIKSTPAEKEICIDIFIICAIR